jgi:flagellar hook-associated protein 2
MAIPLFNMGGLASGLDTDAIISSIMDVEKLPINQLQSRRVDDQIEDNQWSTINTRYSAIRSALDAIDTQSELNGFALASSPSIAVAATVTGTPGAGSTSFTVDQLAANHQVASASNFTGGADLVGADNFITTKGGVDSTITLTASTTLDELVSEINNLGMGVSASVVSVDGTDHKLLLSSDATGDVNTFSTSGTVAALGTMDTIQQGQDAEISIGSEVSALTLSRSTNTISDLIGAAGDPTGLILKITATASAVSGAGGSLSLGQVSFSRGVFGSLDTTIGYAEGSAGRIARAQDLTASQIDLIDDRIEILEDRLDRREALLIRQYAALETAMASMQTQSSWLSQQIASLNGGGE